MHLEYNTRSAYIVVNVEGGERQFVTNVQNL